MNGGNLPELQRAAREAELIAARRHQMYTGNTSGTPGYIPLEGDKAFAMGVPLNANPYDYITQPTQFDSWSKAWKSQEENSAKQEEKISELTGEPIKPAGEIKTSKPPIIDVISSPIIDYKEDLEFFKSGSTRSKTDFDLTLIPRSAMVAMGRRLLLGKGKHGKNNWRKSVEAKDEAWREATITHLFEHILSYLEKGNSEDSNTDAIICNAAFLCEFEEKHPYKGSLLTE